MSAVAEMLHIEAGSLRGFKDRATEAAIQFNEKFHDIAPPARTRNKKGILAAFAAEHRHFLTAPDLSTVMSPGTRRRPSGALSLRSCSELVEGPCTDERQAQSGAAAQVVAPLVRIEVLDGVAQRGPRHRRGVLVEKAPQRGPIPTTRFAQRPADGLVDQVVRVGQQHRGQREHVRAVAGLQEVLGADHGDPPFPHRR